MGGHGRRPLLGPSSPGRRDSARLGGGWAAPGLGLGLLASPAPGARGPGAGSSPLESAAGAGIVTPRRARVVTARVPRLPPLPLLLEPMLGTGRWPQAGPGPGHWQVHIKPISADSDGLGVGRTRTCVGLAFKFAAIELTASGSLR